MSGKVGDVFPPSIADDDHRVIVIVPLRPNFMETWFHDLENPLRIVVLGGGFACLVIQDHGLFLVLHLVTSLIDEISRTFSQYSINVCRADRTGVMSIPFQAVTTASQSL